VHIIENSKYIGSRITGSSRLKRIDNIMKNDLLSEINDRRAG
jgi:hypothetical protein